MRSTLAPKLALCLLSACAANPSTPVGPPLAIPSYAASDPRPKTGGFVREVRLAEAELGGTRFILMAFEVGDRLTLGAMTEGPFAGVARWQLGEVELEFDFADRPASSRVAVDASSVPAGVPFPTGVRAGFGEFRWINIDLETARWFPDRAGPVALAFDLPDGGTVALPPTGAYAATLVAR